MSQLFSIALTLFFVIDALGNVPTYLQLVKRYSITKQRMIALREALIALGIMIMFHYLGQILLTLLELNKATVQISGGIILFLIAIRLIFSQEEDKPKWGDGGLFIVPIATPIVAGPSVLATIMILAQEQPSDWVMIGAIFIAWLFSGLIFLFAQPIFKLIKEKGLSACQRLMGLIVALIAVQIFLLGIDELIQTGM